MDVLLICVGRNDVGMIAVGESTCQFLPHAVGFFRSDFTRHKGLAHVIGDHIILAAITPGALKVFSFCQQELGVSSTVIAGIAGNQRSLFSFVRLLGIVENVPDRSSLSAAFARMKGYQTSGSHVTTLLLLYNVY